MRDAINFWMKNGILMGDGEQLSPGESSAWSYGIGQPFLEMNRWRISPNRLAAGRKPIHISQVFLNGITASVAL